MSRVCLTTAAAVLAASVGAVTGGTPWGETGDQRRVNPNDAWSLLAMHGAYEVERYGDRAIAAQSATTSVLGTVEAVSRGPVFVAIEGRSESRSQLLALTVRVDRLLTGAVADGSSRLRVEFGPFDEADLADLSPYEDLVGEQSVYLLRRKGEVVRGSGSGDTRELARNVYRVVSSRGLLTKAEDGTVLVPLAEESFRHLVDTEDERFDAMVDEVDSHG